MLRIFLSAIVMILLGIAAVTAAVAVPPDPPTGVIVTHATQFVTDPLIAIAAPAPPPAGVVYEYQWRFSTDGANPDGSSGTWSIWGAVSGDTVPTSLLVKGQRWQVRARSVAGSGATAEMSDWVAGWPVYLDIFDSGPIAPTVVTVADQTYYTNDDLTVQAGWNSPSEAVDPDGDVITFRYQWRERIPGQGFKDIPLEIGGQPTGSQTATLSHIATFKNRDYRCRVWGVSGSPSLESPGYKASNIVTVTNTAPPMPGSVSISPQSPFVDDELTAVVSIGIVPVENEILADADQDSLSVARQWALSTDGGFTWSDWRDEDYIDGAEVSRGQVWKARARFNDGEVDGPWRESMTVVVGNTPPVLQVTPLVDPDRPDSVEDLKVARNNRGAPLREVAAGATGIDATDADGDAITYRYQWAKSLDGVTYDPWINGGATLGNDLTSRGERWKARVAAFDGVNYGEWVETSNFVRVKNAAPLPPTGVTFSSKAPFPGEAITAQGVGGSDPDGDSFTYGYSWLRSTDGGRTFYPPEPAVNEAELPAGVTTGSEQWKVEVWTNDGNLSSEVFRSEILIIADWRPLPPISVTLVPESPTSCEDLHALVEAPEQENCTPQYRWLLSRDKGVTWRVFVNPGPDLDDEYTHRGEWWKVTVRAVSDGAVSPWCASNIVKILNSPPDTSLMTVVISPEAPGINDQLQCVVSGATDADGDPTTYLCEWSCSNDQGGQWSDWGWPGLALTGVVLEEGQWWKCRVIATDGVDSAEPVESEPKVVSGAAPGAPTRVWITPEEPTNADDLTGHATNGTPEDEGLYYEFQWSFTNDQGQTWSEWGNDGFQIAESATEVGQWWKVRARATQGSASSSWVQSSPVCIRSTPPVDPTVWIEPENPGPDEELTARADCWDPDGDEVTFEFEWSFSIDAGVTWSAWNWTGEILSPDVTELGQMWRVQARSYDGQNYSEWVISEPVTIMGMLRSMTPDNGDINVCRSSPIWLSFRQPVIESSAETHFRLTGPGGMPVAGDITWVVGSETMRFTPATPLAAGTLYTITLTGGIGLYDGGAFSWTESFSFTTGFDTVVLSHLPTSLTARPGSCIVVVFDQPMRRKSVEDRFTIRPYVSGSFSWVGKKMTFQPDEPLEPGQTYTVCIGRMARAVSGVTLGRPCTWSFTVSESQSVATVSAAAAATSGGAQISVSLSASANVQVVISNIAGRVIATLPAQGLPQGVSTLLWNGRSNSGTTAPSGRYLVRVEASSASGARTNAMATLQR